MIKILSIVPYRILPPKSGGQKAIALFNEFLSKVVDLTCVTVKSNEPAYAKGYQLLNILSNKFYRYVNVFIHFKIRKIVVSRAVSHVLIEHPYYGWLGILLKRFAHTRLIVRSHNIEANRWKSLGKWWWKILWLYECITHRAADYSFFIQSDDMRYAIEHFRLRADRCVTINYGLEWNRVPSEATLLQAKKQLRNKYQIAPDVKILYFNGAFDYPPNLEALHKIIDSVIPLLKQEIGFRYKIIITGSGIPIELTNASHENMIIAGFVNDPGMYQKGADIFINPITRGGGIKTKLVEALGNNLTCVSTQQGAIGIDPHWCNNKLLICAGADWNEFTKLIIEAADVQTTIPEIYFEHFYWGNCIKKAVNFLEKSRSS